MYVNPYAGGPGVGRYWRAYYLAREWMTEGHEVTVVSPAYHHLMDEEKLVGEAEFDGVQYHFLPAVRYSGNGLKRLLGMFLLAITLLWYLIRLPKQKRPDLIIYSSAHPFAYPTALVMSRIYRAKIYFEVRDLWPLSLIEVAGFSPRHPIVWIIGMIERLAYRTSDKVVSLLPGALDHMQAYGLSSEKFIYAPNGFSFKESARKLIEHPLLTDLKSFRSDGEFIYFYAGALGEPNAMHKFVDALEFLSPMSKKIRFVIVGKGEQSKDLRQRCMEKSYDFVSFYEQVDKQIVLEALKVVDAGFFVMHDLPIYRFGISLNKLYDYMAMALPVVGAYKAFNDTVTAAGCGISVLPDSPRDLSNAFSTLASYDVQMLQEMGEKGHAYLMSNFEYKEIARRILK